MSVNRRAMCAILATPLWSFALVWSIAIVARLIRSFSCRRAGNSVSRNECRGKRSCQAFRSAFEFRYHRPRENFLGKDFQLDTYCIVVCRWVIARSIGGATRNHSAMEWQRPPLAMNLFVNECPVVWTGHCRAVHCGGGLFFCNANFTRSSAKVARLAGQGSVILVSKFVRTAKPQVRPGTAIRSGDYRGRGKGNRLAE